MKTVTLCLLFLILCSVIFYSCKKLVDEPSPVDSLKGKPKPVDSIKRKRAPTDSLKPTPTDSVKAAPANPGKPGSCLLTETKDDQGLYDITFTYDAKGNPATVSGGQISYDYKARLAKVQYNSTYYREWKYTDNTSLPAISNVYNAGALVETDRFTYNGQGLPDKVDENNYQTGEFTWQYDYDANGNVADISRTDGGGWFYASGYDDKPNFTGANQWVKYILLAPELGYSISPAQSVYPYLLFSKNNARTWTLNSYYYYFAGYQYNDKGFAIKTGTSFRFFGLTTIFDGHSQTNSFNCQ